ncbi:hypothetical protein [Streptomyces meridianus]|uniref:Uncharacterized protein n=1 Tax=Streptomyces meridianus TaxID=2938945 RepID=A0ABT0XDI8_9ACTN|nr:hypothetical protein [Streptomyces meridianus]MCM2580460.1 hypothetical protein [Streptomyces meridianus]
MTNEPPPYVEPTPEQAELERLKDKYRKQNIANDSGREWIEEEINSGRYSQEDADQLSSNFEEGCRHILDQIQQEIDAHRRAHNMPNR